jgi:C4-dicarboxylate-specific signal transduction histidine kinase
MTASIAHEVLQPLPAVNANADAGLRWLAGGPPNLDRARACLERIARDGKQVGEAITRVRAW